MVTRKIFGTKKKRKMPSLENERSRAIQECAYGQGTETRKACFRSPYHTMNSKGYTKVEMPKKKGRGNR